MAEITAGMVKELRELTGARMMECKKALTEADGDMKKAEEMLRIKSGAKASKAAGRVAAEGVVGSLHLRRRQARARWSKSTARPTSSPRTRISWRSPRRWPSWSPSRTSGRRRRAVGAAADGGRRSKKRARRWCRRSARTWPSAASCASTARASWRTTCTAAKIGVLVDCDGGDEALGKDLAMHIAASKPSCVSKDQVSAELIDSEREIVDARRPREAGKPAEHRREDGRRQRAASSSRKSRCWASRSSRTTSRPSSSC